MGAPSVRLVREALLGEGDSHITRLARWIAPSDGAKYWHIPRSAYLVGPRESRSFRRRFGPGVAVVQFWCGGSRWVDLRTVTNREPTENRCGTCEGRAAGYERANGLIFRPRSDFDVPRYCPSIHTPEKRCPFCDAKPSYRRGYGDYTEVQHRPGERLAALTPCPRHGWKHARRSGDSLVCKGPFSQDCGYLIALADSALPPSRPTDHLSEEV